MFDGEPSCDDVNSYAAVPLAADASSTGYSRCEGCGDTKDILDWDIEELEINAGGDWGHYTIYSMHPPSHVMAVSNISRGRGLQIDACRRRPSCRRVYEGQRRHIRLHHRHCQHSRHETVHLQVGYGGYSWQVSRARLPGASPLVMLFFRLCLASSCPTSCYSVYIAPYLAYGSIFIYIHCRAKLRASSLPYPIGTTVVVFLPFHPQMHFNLPRQLQRQAIGAKGQKLVFLSPYYLAQR